MHAAVEVPAAEKASSLGGRRAVVDGARALAARGDDAVLALVVETAGSTYRKPGAMILLDARGVRAGALSGGCLEGELEDAARAVLAHRAATDVRFDTSGDEDRVFGSGTGCGGSTRVLLLPLPAAASPLRDALLDADTRGLGLRLVVDLDAAVGSGDAQVGRTRIDTRRYRFDRHGGSRIESGALGRTLALELPATPRLLLLGAGPETCPLLQLTRLIGWHSELAEHRARWLRFADGCGVDRVHAGGPDTLPTLFTNATFDAVLVMNHNYLLDARCLTALAETDIGYVGLLGPAARRDDLLAEIGGANAARLRSRLHAPVGLALGGEGAEAIALAIMAQLQNQFSRAARDR